MEALQTLLHKAFRVVQIYGDDILMTKMVSATFFT